MTIAAVYRWPLILAVVIACGLTAALTGDGVARVISWIALGFPIGVVIKCLAPAFYKRQANLKAHGQLKAIQQ
jgi:hypothetical protein